MDLNNLIALMLPVAGLAGVALHQTRTLRRVRAARAEDLRRLASAEQRAADAVADAERSDAVVAKLWLHISPDLVLIYRDAVRLFGKRDANANLRQGIEDGDLKLPNERN